ncbi:thiol-disulfide oxidoreductase DCC family protein [Moritella sp. F3]|uniref:thiol-disulfide oxidoreductase DCC family protein n=1 Tax=Moritella sp. F3 TaxID=2718882 RepID=UPI0018E0EB3D|nr:DUF393 domain-containing protein [Moritella sp. F3]
MDNKGIQITVYYDGACPRCVKDRDNYLKLAGRNAQQVYWFDITGQESVLLTLGIDPIKALTELHVKTSDGRIVSELDAYIELMLRVPLLRPLAYLIGLPLLRPMLARTYHYLVSQRLKRSGRWPH